MRVIGTAGHVDHGKSTLVEKLSGINPDRLAEEQTRSMTIDLGFAWLNLPNDETVGIVDVPGHRDFIENMLAGVAGLTPPCSSSPQTKALCRKPESILLSFSCWRSTE